MSALLIIKVLTMLPREVVPLPAHIYPPEPWRIVETRFSREHLGRAETIFSVGNGYIGIRGGFEEGRPGQSPGTFLNGFHETWPIVHAEDAYGLARTGQTIVNVPDATNLKLYVDDEPLYLPTARTPHYERAIDFRKGVLTRDLTWSTASGKHVRVSSKRFVSFEHRHLVVMTFEIEMLDAAAPVVVSSQIINRQDHRPEDEPRAHADLDPRLGKVFDHEVLLPRVTEQDGHRLLLGYRTANSGMKLGIGVDHEISTACEHSAETSLMDGRGGKMVLTADALPGVPIKVTKYVAYQHSRNVPSRELVDRCGRTIDRAMRDGSHALEEAQHRIFGGFWERADVEVDCEYDGKQVQQAVRWNLFQLAQASWRAEGAGIPAKGLTGQAYEGHYFWDAEVYVLPFLAYTQPRIARNLLRFRHSMLDQARLRAREMAQRGALFPWRSINGEEASAYYAAGTAQYHINADVSHAIRKYVDVRGDHDFLAEVGAEILVETARLWEDLGFYGEDGCFHIHGVTGPDEYTTVVNDNAFTNLMARLNLNYAASSVRTMKEERPEDYRALVHAVGLQVEEIDAWERAAELMFVAFDETRGIHPQDTNFLERERWDLQATPRDRFPLLLHFHPLVIYRFQVLKQADIVLAMFLLGNEFSVEQKRRNFFYYDPLTTGDSSLSACVQSIVAAEVGEDRKALEYFEYALMMDLADIAGNVSDGVHVASTGGVWMALTHGFGGLRDFDGFLSFDPHLPRGWDRLSFPIRFRDRQMRITLTHQEERYEVEEGEPLELTIRGEAHRLEEGRPLVLGPTQSRPEAADRPQVAEKR
jgi:alpha,alpha-trehalose phosphorylase